MHADRAFGAQAPRLRESNLVETKQVFTCEVFMFQTEGTIQRQLFAFTHRDLVATDSDVWLYADLFDQIDIEDFDADYVSQGQSAKDPRLMLRTIFYGLTHGMVSGRKLGEACRNDNRYVVLSGNTQPDGRTFQRFINRHDERFSDLFVQVVRIATAMGLVKLGRVAIDGSRFRANTSKHKAMSYDRMKKAVDEITAELAVLKEQLAEENSSTATDKEEDGRLPREIARREDRLARIQAAKAALEAQAESGVPKDKAQKSFADHDALLLGGKGEFIYGYNAQAAVDEHSQIIVAAHLHDCAADSGALPGMIEAVKETCGQVPTAILADAGYMSAANVATSESASIEPLIAVGKGETGTSVSVAEQLRPGDAPHEYFCPAGKQLPIKGRRSDGSTQLHPDGRFCNKCPMREGCRLHSKRGKTINVPPEPQRQVLARHHARMREEKAKEAYRRRKVICEPVFGNLKNKGLRILVRGAKKVSTWWKIAATAHNIEKIVHRLPSAQLSPT